MWALTRWRGGYIFGVFRESKMEIPAQTHSQRQKRTPPPHVTESVVTIDTFRQAPPHSNSPACAATDELATILQNLQGLPEVKTLLMIDRYGIQDA
jgi:hypothetical protein